MKWLMIASLIFIEALILKLFVTFKTIITEGKRTRYTKNTETNKQRQTDRQTDRVKCFKNCIIKGTVLLRGAFELCVLPGEINQ